MDPGSDNQSVGATTSSSASRNSSAIRQAQEDVSQGLRLNFTKKLYGRCEELTLLQEAFQRVLVKPDEKNDSTEIALVHGDSGCGELSVESSDDSDDPVNAIVHMRMYAAHPLTHFFSF
jgi:hypothetical protein